MPQTNISSSEIIEILVEALTKLNLKLQYLLDSDCCILPEGHFTFPDGETWSKSVPLPGQGHECPSYPDGCLCGLPSEETRSES